MEETYYKHIKKHVYPVNSDYHFDDFISYCYNYFYSIEHVYQFRMVLNKITKDEQGVKDFIVQCKDFPFEAYDYTDNTLITTVAIQCYGDLLEYILTKRPDLVNYADDLHRTPLFMLIEYSTKSEEEIYKIVEIFLKHNAYPLISRRNVNVSWCQRPHMMYATHPNRPRTILNFIKHRGFDKIKQLLEDYIDTYCTSLKTQCVIKLISELKVPLENSNIFNMLPDQKEYILKIRDIHFRNKFHLTYEQVKELYVLHNSPM